MTKPKPAPGQKKFLILGLPRSGTTYLMTLLNAHRDVLCAGEQFNPYAIIDAQSESRDFAALAARDQGARAFSDSFFTAHADSPCRRIGYKFMIGHNINLLAGLPDMRGLSLIYVYRRNKLAQISSLIKANQTKRWAQAEKDAHVTRKIDAGPLQISQSWHEFATQDFLFSRWFETLPQRRLTLEYCDLFEAGFERKICDFLRIKHDPEMKSPLVKQGNNRIIDRFETPGPIRSYFTQLGREAWLGRELPTRFLKARS